MSLFFASEVFPVGTIPSRVAPVLQCLQVGDCEAGTALLEMFDAGDLGLALFAQIRSGFFACANDYQSAYDGLASVVESLEVEEQAKFYFQMGVCAQAMEKVRDAVSCFQNAKSLCPQNPFFLCAYADCIWSAQGEEAGRAAYASVMPQMQGAEVGAQWARRERQAGHNKQALSIVLEALSFHPDDPDLINILATCYLQEKSYEDVIAVLARLTGDFANHPIVCCNRASALFALGRYEESTIEFQRAVHQAPDMIEAIFGLGRSQFFIGNDEAAEIYLKRALANDPTNIEVIGLLAHLYFRTKRTQSALEMLEQSIEHTRDLYPLYFMHAVACYRLDNFEQALNSAQAAMKISPDSVELRDLCGLLAMQSGRMEEALSLFAGNLNSLVPRTPEFYSNWLYALTYQSSCTVEEHYAAHVSFGERFGGLADDLCKPFLNSVDPERKLRIGYVSPDFRAHSVFYFLSSILERHNRDSFEIYAYSNTAKHDAVTGWCCDVVDHWCDIRARTNEEIREQILRDQIDILVDLAGHTGDNLLNVFARRLAPVQVNYLGYPNTTGVKEMDYRLVDEVTDPPGKADELATETLYRLPNSFLCYRMIDEIDPVDSGPMSRDYPMTFGSFNNLNKIDETVFDAWADILHRVPAANLMLKSKQLSNDRAVCWVREEFSARGIKADRLRLVAFSKTLGEHLSLYSEIDLALDTFPYNGTTTTCEAFSMGVPVLTVSGDRHCARVGESLIRTLGLERFLLAADIEEYIERAVAFAAHREDLAYMRQNMRSILATSPLCDEKGFVENLETAYRQMWREWCVSDDRRYSRTSSQFDLDMAAKCAKN